MDEAATFDRDMVDEMRDALDMLLIFAALFSAIVTTFVSQTFQQLSPDYTQMTAFLVYESIQTQKALANGTQLSSIYHSPITPLTPFTADLSIVWVNGLWFASLTLSLIAALAAVLVKQWLRQYITLPSGTVRERACTRHFRYMGFQTWQVAGIVGFLPVLVHVSVGIFLGGIVLFLLPVQRVISLVIAVIAGVVFILYAVVNVIPVFAPICPYRTPISDFIYWVYCLCAPALNRVSVFREYHTQPPPRTLKLKEKDVVQSRHEPLVKAIFWLYDMSSNPIVRTTAMQAVGALPQESLPVAQQLATSSPEFSTNLVHEVEVFDCQPEIIDKRKLERLLRAWCICFLNRDYPGPQRLVVAESIFRRRENAYAIAALLDTGDGPWERFAKIQEILSGNVSCRRTYKLPAAIWDLYIHELGSRIEVYVHDLTFPFVRDITFAFVRNIVTHLPRAASQSWEVEGLTLSQYVCVLWKLGSRSLPKLQPCSPIVLQLLPEPASFSQFSGVYGDSLSSWDESWRFIISFRLVLCYFERLNAHAEARYDGIDAVEEHQCIRELDQLVCELDQQIEQGILFESPAYNLASVPLISPMVTPVGRYLLFLEAVLASSPFWDVDPACHPDVLESIQTLKEKIKAMLTDQQFTLNQQFRPSQLPVEELQRVTEIELKEKVKAVFSYHLNQLKQLMHLAAVEPTQAPVDVTDAVDNEQGDLEMGVINSGLLVAQTESIGARVNAR